MKLATGVVVLTAVAALTAGQQPQFRTSVARVRLDVRVADANGPVRGLTRDDFVVEDNSFRQAINIEEAADAHLDLVLVAQPIE